MFRRYSWVSTVGHPPRTGRVRHNAVVITRATGRPYLDAQGWGRDGRPLAFAHRGGAEVPELVGAENTLVAFEHAAALGYTYLETDVHLTSDGVLVAFHDDDLARVTDAVGPVAERTWAEVQRARINGVHPIPAFADLVAALPHARFNIDLKAPGTPAALAAFIDAHDLHDRVLVSSFHGGRLAEFRRLSGGRVATGGAQWEIVAFMFLPARVAQWLTRGRVNALQVPHRHRGITVTSPRLVRRAHAAGAQVHVWTIDDPAEMAELLDMGVDGLMTDRTDLLKDVLSDRGLWKD